MRSTLLGPSRPSSSVPGYPVARHSLWLHVLTRSKGRFSEAKQKKSNLRDSLRDSSPEASIDAKHGAFEVRHCNTPASRRLQAGQTQVPVLLSTRTRVPAQTLAKDCDKWATQLVILKKRENELKQRTGTL